MNKQTVLSYVRRCFVMLPSVPLIALAVFLCVSAGLGVDAYAMFQQGVSIQTGITLGTAVLIIDTALMVVFLLLDPSMFGPGCLIMSFGVGPFIDIFYAVLGPYMPEQPDLWLQITFYVLGLIVLAFALTWYIPLNVGLATADLVAVYLSNKLHITVGNAMIILYVVCFALGFFMGGQWGVGTAVGILATGKLMDLFMPFCGKAACKLAGMPFEDGHGDGAEAQNA